MGYNSIGLVEGLAHQTHLQHVNDDGKEVICVPAISGPGTWASSPTATSTLVSTDMFPLDFFSLGMRTKSGTQTCVQNRLHTTCCHSNTSYPHPIPYPAHKQTTYVETLTVQDKYKTIHLTPSHLPPKSAVYAPPHPHLPLFILAFPTLLPHTLIPTHFSPSPSTLPLPPTPHHTSFPLFTHTRPHSTTPCCAN